MLDCEIEAEGLQKNSLTDQHLLFELPKLSGLDVRGRLFLVLLLVCFNDNILELLRCLLDLGSKEYTGCCYAEPVVVTIRLVGKEAVVKDNCSGNCQLWSDRAKRSSVSSAAFGLTNNGRESNGRGKATHRRSFCPDSCMKAQVRRL